MVIATAKPRDKQKKTRLALISKAGFYMQLKYYSAAGASFTSSAGLASFMLKRTRP